MDGFEQARAVAQARAGHQAEAAGNDGGEVAEDVPEQVLGDDHVVAAGVRDDQHGDAVHVLVVQVNATVVAVTQGGHVAAPQFADFQHVGLVHAGHAAPALLGGPEGDLRDALDLGGGVAHGVVGGVAVDLAVAVEVHAAQQFTHDQDVHAARQFRLQRGQVFQAGLHAHRAQVGVAAQSLAQRQQAAFRAQVAGQQVPGAVLRAADRAQQHRVGVFQGVAGGLRERVAVRVEGHAADQVFLDGHVGRDLAQHLHGRRRDFRADAVAGQGNDLRHAAPPGRGGRDRPAWSGRPGSRLPAPPGRALSCTPASRRPSARPARTAGPARRSGSARCGCS